MDKVASLIPGIYYDLIGRVIPGAVLCVVLILNGNIDLDKLDSLGLLHLVGFLAAYTLGFLLDIFSSTVVGWPNRVLFQALGQFSEVWKAQVWETITAEDERPHAAKLTKMMAERVMLRSFLVLSVGIWIADPWPTNDMGVFSKVAFVAFTALLYYRMEFLVRLAAHTINERTR